MATKLTASNGKSVRLSQATIDSLVKDMTTRCFAIGSVLEHENGDEYLLTRVKVAGGFRAYLHNESTGRARNSRKVVMVETDMPDEYPNGYVTDIPAEKDRFYDPDGDGEFLDC